MKKYTLISLITLLLVSPVRMFANPPIYVAFQWHMHQPIYQPGQTVVESQNSGTFSYSLYDIFTSRSGPYTSWPSNAVNKMTSFAHAGAQMSFSGSLVENLNCLESNGIAFSGWKSGLNNETSRKTSLGHQRLDMVAFGYYHPLMPLIDTMDIRKQIEKHKSSFASNFPSFPYSKGIFPPENAFQEQMIPALKAVGLEWVMVDNQHMDRACVNQPWAASCNVEKPNKADQVNSDPNDWKSLNGLWAPIPISAGWGHRPHWIKYVDPSTGVEYRMIAVPTSTFFGNEDARGGFGALNYESCLSQLESYNTDAAHPILVVLHHDGDNYGGGTDSYYGSNFDSFVSWLNSNPSRFVCTTIQDYLDQFPPATNDVIHVEAGSWSGAGSDPEFLKWNGDPDSNGYSPDQNSWSIMTAASNIVHTADKINPSSGNTAAAWNLLMTGQTSCYWYWDGTEDWDSKPTRAANMATAQAITVVNSGNDQTPPSIYHPQREPYNPGGIEWVATLPSDFTVWTYVFDVSGLSSVKLKYRTDYDGKNPISSNQNETYAGGSEVSAWKEIDMTKTTIPSKLTLQPAYKADKYSAEITGLKDTLVDYYIEATDTKGNVARSFISHVWVGNGSGSSGGGSTTSVVSWSPVAPTSSQSITVTIKNKSLTTAPFLHWGVNAATTSATWTAPIATYQPNGTIAFDSHAVETSFTHATDSTWIVTVGPFNNSSQAVSYFDFVIKYNSNSWDNNGGNNYMIGISQVTSNNPTGKNISKTLDVNGAYTFTTSDFGFSSPLSNTFAGIKVVTLPTSGTLALSGAAITAGQMVSDVTHLAYTAGSGSGSFTYRILDSGGLMSDATYTAAFTVSGTSTITVRFQKPDAWSAVYFYAWTGTSTAVLGSWPGKSITVDADGWYSYTFDSSVTSVNLVFNGGAGSSQSVDVTGITSSVCYKTNGTNSGKYLVVTTDCPYTAINELKESDLLLFPNPVTDILKISSKNEVENVNIYGIYGNLIKKLGNVDEISFSDIEKGVYILKIKVKGYEKETVCRIVKR